jgi:hypothetical protein
MHVHGVVRKFLSKRRSEWPVPACDRRLSRGMSSGPNAGLAKLNSVATFMSYVDRNMKSTTPSVRGVWSIDPQNT